METDPSQLKLIREFRPFPKGPMVRIVELPKEPLFTPELLAKVKRTMARKVRDEADLSIVCERRLARHWKGAAGGDRWEPQRYKRTGYQPGTFPDR